MIKLIRYFLVFLNVSKSKRGMYNPLTIATFFLEKDKGKTMTPMKLVKLVYIAQGWYLALTDGKPLISEKAEAWKYGPVIPSIYHRFKEFRNNVITDIPTIDTKFINHFDREILEGVWNNYGSIDGLQLSAKTHENGTPWYKVWEKAKNTLSKEDLIIPNELIHQHYKKILDINESKNK